MIRKLTKKQLRELIAEVEISCEEDEDGDLMLVLEADDDFPYDVSIWFTVSNDGDSYTAISRCTDLEVEDALGYVNDYNLNHGFLTAVSTDAETAVGFDVYCDLEGLSEEYFAKTYIENYVGQVWNAYCELYGGDEE